MFNSNKKPPVFKKKLSSNFLYWLFYFTLTPTMYEWAICSASSPALVTVSLFNFNYFLEYIVASHLWFLIYISLVTNNFHHFSWTYCSFIYPLLQSISPSLCPFKNTTFFILGITLSLQKSLKNGTESSCISLTQFFPLMISYITMMYLSILRN